MALKFQYLKDQLARGGVGLDKLELSKTGESDSPAPGKN